MYYKQIETDWKAKQEHNATQRSIAAKRLGRSTNKQTKESK